MASTTTLPHGQTLSPFFYDFLPTTDPQQFYIRVFNLLPGPPDAPIEGHLSTVPFGLDKAQRPDYECLSYAWGDVSDTTNILVDGDQLPVTRSLYTALHRFRLPNRARTLWIDAICINQHNAQEKSQQVGSMKQIYEAATHVLVWLGESFEGSETAFSTFRRHLTSLGPGALKIWRARKAKSPGYELQPGERFAWEHDKNIAGSDEYYHNPMYESLGHFDVFAQRLQDWVPEDAAPHEDDKTDNDGNVTVPISGNHAVTILLFMSRLYWTRIWVVQEIAVAKEAVVCCGADELDWWLLNLSLGFMTASLKAFVNEAGVSRFTSICLTRHALLAGSLESSKPHISMALSILQHYRSCAATDKRDKIYALLGILKHMGVQLTILPDYTIDARQLYINLARIVIHSTPNLDLLAITHGRDATLPSWAPDWSDDSLHPNPLFPLATPTDPSQASCKPYTACGGTIIPSGNLIHGNRLILRGYPLDTLTHICPPFRWIDGDKTISDLYRAMYNHVQDHPGEPLDPELERPSIAIPLEFWKTMRAWHVLATDSRYDPYPFTGEPAETALIRTLEGDQFPDGIERITAHWRQVWSSLEAAIAASARLLSGEQTKGDRELAIAPIRMPGTDKEWDAPLYGPANRRCLGRTGKGYLALVGREARVGDEVVLLQGGRTPYVVRRGEGIEVESGEWRFVCDAYVHGLMDGEGWDAGRCEEMIFV